MVPLAAILFVLLKAYVVARYSLTTAGALVSAAPVSVLVGTVTSYLNLVIVLVAVGSGAWLLLHRFRAGREPPSRSLDALVFGAFVGSVALLPVPNKWGYYLLASGYLVLTGLVVLGAWRLTVRLADRPGLGWLRPMRDRPQRFLAVYVLLLLAPTLRSPWVPAEVLVLRHPVAITDSHLRHGRLPTSRYPVVFVLAEDDPWLTVIDERSRALERLPIDEVAHRQVCHYTGQAPNSVPLLAYLAGKSFRSPNSFCRTLIKNHASVLDPLVDLEPSTPSPDSGSLAPTP